VKANSTLPSSAAAERLFNIAGMILSPRRCKMTDKLFDEVVFLKIFEVSPCKLAFRLHSALVSNVSMPFCSLQFNCDFRTIFSKQNILRIFFARVNSVIRSARICWAGEELSSFTD
jgi:hypothetical protein